MAQLSMKRGDSAVFTGTVVMVPGSTPRDITGDTLYFTCKTNSTQPDGEAAIQKSALMPGSEGVDIFSTAPETGVYFIKLDPEDTDDLAQGGSVQYNYDVQLVTSDGDVWTIEEGTLTINPDITRTNDPITE